jgi:hypothetical protein
MTTQNINKVLIEINSLTSFSLNYLNPRTHVGGILNGSQGVYLITNHSA